MACQNGAIAGLRMGLCPGEVVAAERSTRIAADPFLFCGDRGGQNHVQQFFGIGGAADQLAV